MKNVVHFLLCFLFEFLLVFAKCTRIQCIIHHLL